MVQLDLISWKSNVNYVHKFLQQSYSGATAAYDTLSNYKGDTKYHLSLSFLSIADQSFIEAKRFYHAHEDIERVEIEEFFKKYEDFKFEITETISKKDSNTSWLGTRYDFLKDSMIELNQLIK